MHASLIIRNGVIVIHAAECQLVTAWERIGIETATDPRANGLIGASSAPAPHNNLARHLRRGILHLPLPNTKKD